MHNVVSCAPAHLCIHWCVLCCSSDARSWNVCKYMYISCSIPANRFRQNYQTKSYELIKATSINQSYVCIHK